MLDNWKAFDVVYIMSATASSANFCAAAVGPRPFETADQVDANIFIGGYIAASDPNYIRRTGITRIVKMFGDTNEYPGGYHRHRGVAYAVFPALDAPDYDIRRDAIGALRFIKEGLDADERILVHCHAGVSRSGTVVLLYLMILRGYELDTALAFLRSVRPVVRPNDGFMRFLRATDISLRRRRAGRVFAPMSRGSGAPWVFVESEDSTPLA